MGRSAFDIGFWTVQGSAGAAWQRRARRHRRAGAGAHAIRAGAIFGALFALGGAGCDADSDGRPAGCDPLAEDACARAEKCSLRIESEDPFTATLACVPEGNVLTGGLCGFLEPGDNGFDDCARGDFCLDARCAAICDFAAAGCAAEHACVGYAGIFEEQGLGVCTPLCAPTAAPEEACADGRGCYLTLSSGRASCHAPGVLAQGEICEYIDACAPGLGCVLLDDSGTASVCAAFCDPASGVVAGGGTCADALGGAAEAPRCVSVRDFYSDTPAVPADVGMCLDCAAYPAQGGCDASVRR
ncbi:hypothetical protein [Haliangium ochraceum]|uniref:Uncharacterized protein n=1 Tax=Haliangium ochraceum (strain DSM 14365 / JCM 11303 / SMP-2) TaxID=502025 RepID=D0LGZ6_HALO1|nr:hypothetical protein [Haliangium ochraceum]ACY14718.1 hypothetical protein Hoch_2173 [Haliangium ochraceum DSM 14365]